MTVDSTHTADGDTAVDDIYVGKDLGWREVPSGPDEVAEYVAVTGDDHPWYREASPFGAPVLPATFLHFEAYRHNPGWFPAVQYGTLFARLRFQWCRPLLVGEHIRSHAWVSEIRRKGERWHITCDVDVYDGRDRLTLHTRTTQTFLVETDQRGFVRSRAAGADGPRRATAATELAGPTVDLDPYRKLVTTEECVRFFGGTRNYHTDVEESVKMGFDDIVVGGPMSVCYLGRALTANLGADLFAGADLDIRFVDILWPDLEIEISGRRAAAGLPELGRERFPFELQIRDPGGRVTVLARGSYATTP